VLALAGEFAAAAKRSAGFVPISSPASARAIGWETVEPNIVMESDAGNIGAEAWLEGSERMSGWG
jgi:hypothetical protein